MTARLFAATLALVVLAACSGGGGGAPTCQATTCATAGRTCGSMSDGCGGTLSCGSCAAGQLCGSAGTCVGTVGTACAADGDCAGAGDLCIFGFCTRTCGLGGEVFDGNCNAPGVANPDGAFGGAYRCFALGTGFASLCWPNGTGAPCTPGGGCPRPDETCVSNRCEYGSSIPRSQFRCHGDGECMAGEACAMLTNLDASPDVRTEGACLWTGDLLAGGASCAAHEECASRSCVRGTCEQLCAGDSDCPGDEKCVALGVVSGLEEYSKEFATVCRAWGGSRAACAGSAGCPAGEACFPHQALNAGSTAITLAGACGALRSGAPVGGACAADEDCAHGWCVRNAFTGVGYCTAPCLGGEADCGGGTSCRPALFSQLDPVTAADDLRASYCFTTTPGSACRWEQACTPCTLDSQCNPAQGVTCRKPAGQPTGHCRDAFGRCGSPCRTDCTPGGAGNGGCPDGWACTTHPLGDGTSATANACTFDAHDGLPPRCLPADLVASMRYGHGQCGDEGEADLCYYQGWTGSEHVFACGERCPADGGACADLPTATGSIPTTCRPVYQFGFEPAGGGPTAGGAPLSPPDQCAPADAFTPAQPGGTPPTVPVMEWATAASASQIDVTWTTSTDDVGVAGYHLFRDGVLHRKLGPVTSFSDVGLAEPGERHCYRVAAYDVSGYASAQSAERCAATRPQDLAYVPGSPYIQDLALDTTHVYFMESASGAVKRVPLGGGTVETLATAAASPSYPHCIAIAVHAGDVYFSHVRPGESTPSINKVPAVGGAATRLTPAGEWHYATSIAADDTGVYWTEVNHGKVKRVGLSGGAVTELVSGLTYPRGLAVDGTDVYVAEGGATTASGYVKKVPKAGGAVTTLASGLDATWGLAVDAASVYWTEKTPSGRVGRAGLAGGAGNGATVISGVSEPYAIALGAADLYWSEMSGGNVWRIPLSGGPHVLVGWEGLGAFALRLDSRYLYWSSQYHVRRSLR